MSIYLDYAATTPLDGAVLESMLPYLKENFGNADSLHAYGRRAAYAVENARERVAAVLGVKPYEVYFTSGGTEADNWAVRRLGEGQVCVSSIEHRAVLESASLRAGGYCTLPVKRDGIADLQRAQEALSQNVGLMCVMAVNNETGVVQPLKELSALCKASGTLLFSDCVQAASELDLKELFTYCDAIALSAHKIYGPKGTGALVVKKGAKLRPLIAGGQQERNLRGGTLNVAGIVGFAAALERAQSDRVKTQAHLRGLRDLFESRLSAALGDRIKVDGTMRIGAISHLTFRCGGSAFLTALDLNGVSAAGGAACSAHSALPSHVMLAMGRSAEEALRGVRFSFGKCTTEAEVLSAVQIVCDTVKKQTG